MDHLCDVVRNEASTSCLPSKTRNVLDKAHTVWHVNIPHIVCTSPSHKKLLQCNWVGLIIFDLQLSLSIPEIQNKTTTFENTIILRLLAMKTFCSIYVYFGDALIY
jgi:hypothetical protein